MNDIVFINLKKLLFVFGFLALVFGVLIAIIFGLAAASGTLPSLALGVDIIIVGVLLMPLFYSLVALFAWYYNYRSQSQFYNLIRDSHLIPIGLHREIKDKATRWKFAAESYTMQVDGWKIVLQQQDNNAAEMVFIFFKGSKTQQIGIEKVFVMTKKEILDRNADDIKLFLIQYAGN